MRRANGGAYAGVGVAAAGPNADADRGANANPGAGGNTGANANPRAGANANENEGEEWEKLKKARRLQELFKGRFEQKDACKILRFTNWDLQEAVTFCFEAEPQTIREVLGGEEWQTVENCRRNNALRAAAIGNRIQAEFRQFACQPCDKVWWRKVPGRKMVSRCPTCKNKYDALAKDLEWGWAKFQCQCGNEFHGFGAMNKTYCACYGCGRFCYPVEIMPPFKRARGRGRRSRNQHSCTAPNCFNRSPPGPQVPVVNLCVHPNSLQRKVVQPSQRHVSTGSTVKTFLTQDELADEYAYEPSLADISDLDESDDGNHDNR